MNLDVTRFLQDVEGRYAGRYHAAVQSLLVAMARGNKAAAADARKDLEEVVAETMGIGEVLGATIMLRSAAGVYLDAGAVLRADTARVVAFREAATQTLLPRVTFDESLQDMIDRTPVTLRQAAERTAQRISELYSQGRVVAFARSAEQAVTERVQSLIVQALREGLPEAEAGSLIRMGVDEIRLRTEPWTESYARMAFRTNVNTAVTAGRFRQAQDQDVRQVIPCFRFDAVGDSDTRDNHEAANGRIWRVSNPVWNRLAPPLGFNCRCQASLVSMPELQRLGRIGRNGAILEDSVPSDAFPDPGFRHGGRPDLFITQGVA